jgi:hypothetical protein
MSLMMVRIIVQLNHQLTTMMVSLMLLNIGTITVELLRRLALAKSTMVDTTNVLKVMNSGESLRNLDLVLLPNSS